MPEDAVANALKAGYLNRQTYQREKALLRHLPQTALTASGLVDCLISNEPSS
jgi:hypothetical protein